jgi:hypothetical protein
MTNRTIEPHQAQGPLVLTAIHFGDGVPGGGLAEIMSLRWKDTGSGKEGQSSRARLALHVERGDDLYIEVSGRMLPVRVASDGRSLCTAGHDDGSNDPILRLPTY